MSIHSISILNINLRRLGGIWRFSYITIATVFLIFVLMWYVLSVNAVIATGYSVGDAASYKESILSELESLDARLVQISRPEELEMRANELGFMPVQNPSYLAVPGDAVARR